MNIVNNFLQDLSSVSQYVGCKCLFLSDDSSPIACIIYCLKIYKYIRKPLAERTAGMAAGAFF